MCRSDYTVMTTMDRLFKKGLLARRKAGRAFVYRAAATRQELTDQRGSLKLIASENYASLPVLLTMGTWLSDKYAEGTVGHRFYAGCQNVDTVESVAAEHELERERPRRGERRGVGFGRSRGTMPIQLAGNVRFGGLFELAWAAQVLSRADFREGRGARTPAVGRPPPVGKEGNS